MAIAELLEFERTGDVYLVLDALESSSRAVELAPRAAEPRCNLALVLAAHHLRGAASESWEACRELSDESWHSVIDEERAQVAQPSILELWRRARTGLTRAVTGENRVEVARIVAIDPQAAREAVVLEILPLWAERRLASDNEGAGAALAEARAVGEALLARGGDWTALGAVRAIEAADPARGDDLALARGHLAYATGFSFVRPSYQASEARGPLRRAVQELGPRGSPVALWAEKWLAIEYLHADRFEELIGETRQLLRKAESGPYPALAGRIHWAMGMARARQGDWMEALYHFREARSRFEAAGEVENLGAVENLVAEADAALGRERQAWEGRRRAGALLSDFPASRSLHNVLWQGGEALLASGRPRAARHHHDADLRVADRVGDPLIAAEARIRRHRVWSELGDLRSAARDLDDASTLAAEIDDPSRRERIEARLAAMHGELSRTTDPEAALSELDRAVRFYRGREIEIELARVHLARARSHRDLGRPERAEGDLLEAVASLDRQRQRIGARAVNRSFLEARQEVFDELISLRAERPGGAEAGLEASERARHVDGDAALISERLRGGLEGLPAEVEVVELAWIGDRLHRWHIADGRIELTTRRVDPEGLAARIDGYLEAIATRNAAREERLGTALGKMLIPERRGSSRIEHLVVVPDRSLGRVPFAALRDPATGRRLAEDRTVLLAPSILDHLAARKRSSARSAGVPKQLVAVGDPAFERARYPELPPLPASRDEVAEVGSLYDEPRLLIGLLATVSALLEALPRAEVLHFAGHAVDTPFEPANARLVLAPAGHGAPALLSGAELGDLDLSRLRLAVLSACGTTTPPEQRTSVLSGVAGALLEAGVPAVLGAAWPVPDAESRQFFTAFHRAYRETGDPAEALARTQREFIHHPDPTLRDPAFWAAYTLVGSGAPRED